MTDTTAQDEPLIEPDEPAAPTTAKPTLKDRAKGALTHARTYIKKQPAPEDDGMRGIATISAIIAFLSLLGLFVLFGWNTILFNSPAFYRGVLLCGNAVFAVTLVALFFDIYYGYEMFDFWTAFITGAIATFFDVFVLVIEIQRWRRCPAGISQTDFDICNFHAGQEAVVPWFAVGVALLFAIGLLLLVVWYGLFRSPMTQAKIEKRRKSREAYLSEKPNYIIAAMSAVSLVVILAVMVMEIIPFVDDGPLPSAFFRGTFLLMPAAFFGAEFAYFGHTNKGFTIFAFVLGIIGNFSLIFAFIFEVARFFKCALGHLGSTLDNRICNDEGWFAFVLPSVLLFLIITGITTEVLLGLRIWTSDWSKKIKEAEE